MVRIAGIGLGLTGFWLEFTGIEAQKSILYFHYSTDGEKCQEWSWLVIWDRNNPRSFSAGARIFREKVVGVNAARRDATS